MSEWLHEQRKKFTILFIEYGKLFFSILFFLICLVSISLVVSLTTPSPLRVSFLDVGQGDAILIQTPSNKSMLIDGGVSSIVLSRLAERLSFFDHTIDVMVATHPDADHVTGLIPVLEKYDVQNIVTSSVEGDTKIFSELAMRVDSEVADVHVAKVGDVIDFHDGVVAYILYPDSSNQKKNGETNDASVSMIIRYGDKSFLLTGDLPTTKESKLFRPELQKNITVYKAGHHGSKYSSGEQLLSYIKPEYSIISAGKDNRYGHPNPEALGRLQKYSQEIISTIERGTITFSTNGKNLEVVTTK